MESLLRLLDDNSTWRYAPLNPIIPDQMSDHEDADGTHLAAADQVQ